MPSDTSWVNDQGLDILFQSILTKPFVQNRKYDTDILKPDSYLCI